MTFNISDHQRQTARLPGYDYSQAGGYFVTICAYKRIPIFGNIVLGKVVLNDCGKTVADSWLETNDIRPQIEICDFIVMPNHLHGVVMIRPDCRGTQMRARPVEKFGSPTSDSISSIIRGFKSATTKRINELRQSPGLPVWQRNYYEHVIRDEADMSRVCEYIGQNPARWAEDEENPECIKK